jgi:alkylhydroperoxidase family enzyme
MEARLNLFASPVAGKFGKHIVSAGKVLADSTLPAATRHLVEIRAALELAEQGTRLADTATGVTDEAWANAVSYYDEAQLAVLVCAIAFINAFNRVSVIVRQPAGDYQPGQFA